MKWSDAYGILGTSRERIDYSVRTDYVLSSYEADVVKPLM